MAVAKAPIRHGRYFATCFFGTKKKAEKAVSWLKRNGGTYIKMSRCDELWPKRLWRVRAKMDASKLCDFFDIGRHR